MLTVTLGESTMSSRQVQLCYNWFKEGWENVNDNARPDRPSTSTTNENIEPVKKIISNNRRITISDVADDLGMLFDSWQAILTDVLGMKLVQRRLFHIC